MGEWFRKKPIAVEAEQIHLSLFGFNPFAGGWPSANNPFNAVVMRRPRWWKAPVPMVETLEGWLTVSPGDWIIRGVGGEIYPCKPDIFAQTYEPAEPKGEAQGRTGAQVGPGTNQKPIRNNP